MDAAFLFYTLVSETLYFLFSPIIFAIWGHKTNAERLAINYPRTHYQIIVHAASVGEINGIKQLLIDILETHPNLRILLTTNTKTGRHNAQNIHPRLDVMLSPLDLMHLRLKQFRFSQPQLILIAETEIWPSLLFAAKKIRIPVVYINARLTEKSLRRYLKMRKFWQNLGRSVKTVCAQTDSDRKRFAMLFGTECITASNLKFSVRQPNYDESELRKEMGYSSDAQVLVLGSSRPKEEQLLLQSYDSLKPKYPNLKLIIVPRHLKRLVEIVTLLAGRDFSRFSQTKQTKDIHLIDEMGQLLAAYAVCDIAIIGGSFFPYGGHNPLEAAYYRKAIVMGPHFDSCRGSVHSLQAANAILISSKENLTVDLDRLLSASEERKKMGERAKQVLDKNANSLDKHLAVINQYLGE